MSCCKRTNLGELPGGLAVRILGFHCHEPGSIPGGDKFMQAVWCNQKNTQKTHLFGILQVGLCLPFLSRPRHSLLVPSQPHHTFLLPTWSLKASEVFKPCFVFVLHRKQKRKAAECDPRFQTVCPQDPWKLHKTKHVLASIC